MFISSYAWPELGSTGRRIGCREIGHSLHGPRALKDCHTKEQALDQTKLLRRQAAPKLFHNLVRLASSLLAPRLLLLRQRLRYQSPASWSARSASGLTSKPSCCAAREYLDGSIFPRKLGHQLPSASDVLRRDLQASGCMSLLAHCSASSAVARDPEYGAQFVLCRHWPSVASKTDKSHNR